MSIRLWRFGAVEFYCRSSSDRKDWNPTEQAALKLRATAAKPVKEMRLPPHVSSPFCTGANADPARNELTE
jgi:hypothetical protein